MGALGQSRRRLIRSRGRLATLRRIATPRPVAYTDVTLLVFERVYQPGELIGGLQQGDAQLATLNDEISAAGWPGPPRAGDLVVLDNQHVAVLGVEPIYDGADLIGYNLWTRG